MTYDEFKAFVRDLAQRDDITIHGLLAIPDLRRECAPRLGRDEVDAYLVRLHEEGLVHLLSHVEFDSLPEAARQDALHYPAGPPLYWLRWL